MIYIPTTCGHKDSKGSYCKWGEHGAHYYYTPGDEESMKRARSKADTQGRAVRATGWIGKSEDINKVILSLDTIQNSLNELKKRLKS